MAGRTQRARFVLCTDNSGFPAALEVRKLYRVLPDAAAKKRGLLRIVDESGEDYLYPSDLFVPIDVSASTARLLVEQA